MGLKVWLPLNGTLDNKGLSDITVTNNGATVSTAGKIGSCYQFGQNKTVTGVLDINETPVSAAVWMYLDSFQGTYDYILSLNNSGGYADQCIAITLESDTKIVFCVGGVSTLKYTCPSTLVGRWVHIAITHDGSTIRGYVDGVEVCSLNSSTSLKRSNLTIGCRNGSTTYYTNCKLNDVRIYDHCLSAKEVREISQGLILHYGLDIEPKNLVPFLLTTENYTQSNHQSRTSSTISDFVYHVDGLQSETSQDTSYKILSTNYVTLPSNTTVYLSFHCKGKNSINLFFGTSGYSAITRLIDSSNNTYFPKTQVNIGTEFDGRVVLAITTGSSTQYKIQIGMDTPNLYGIGSYIEYKDIMISTEIPRNYVPYIGDVITVYDSSGYRNDGIVNGTITPVDDSPRYVGSTSFNGTSYIQLTSPSTEVRTVAFWAKWNSIPSGQSVVFVDQKSKIGFGLMSTGILCSTNSVNTKTFPKTSIVANQWYHFAIVNTSSTPTATTRDLYINGVKQTPTTSTTNWTYALDYLQVGKRSTTSDGFAGNLSDFRMYTTAMSAEDIMDLYSTSAYIHNTGTMSCFGINESSENLLKYENTVLYTKPTNTDTRGKYTTRNGETAMKFRATDTYYGSGDERNSKLLYGFFKENTSYVFDLWIDVDDIVYQDINRLGGFTIIYTDGTTETTFQLTGSRDPYAGWQHRVLVTNPNKTVKSISIYYWSNSLFYVRADSFIVECSQTYINENGVVDSGNFIENTDVANIGKATFNSNHIIEI
jgi:hypothetical protein